MESLSYYDRSKEKYSEEESMEIKKEYEIDKHSIIEIGKKHTRTPGSIAYRLKIIGIVHHPAVARGYTEYKASELYKEVCKEYEKKDGERKEKREERVKAKETLSVSGMSTTKTSVMLELATLKKDMEDIKKDIKQILTYMTAVYEFENDE